MCCIFALALPSLALLGLSFCKLSLGELVAPGTQDMCAMCTTEYAVYKKYAKRTVRWCLHCIVLPSLALYLYWAGIAF